jgi:hypothetical protein
MKKKGQDKTRPDKAKIEIKIKINTKAKTQKQTKTEQDIDRSLPLFALHLSQKHNVEDKNKTMDSGPSGPSKTKTDKVKTKDSQSMLAYSKTIATMLGNVKQGAKQ